MFCRKSKKILDADLRAEAAALAGTLTDQAGRAAEWVAPRVVRARREVARAARQAQERLEAALEVVPRGDMVEVQASDGTTRTVRDPQSPECRVRTNLYAAYYADYAEATAAGDTQRAAGLDSRMTEAIGDCPIDPPSQSSTAPPSQSHSPTPSQSPTASATPSASQEPSGSPTPSESQSASASPTPSPEASASASPSPSPSPGNSKRDRLKDRNASANPSDDAEGLRDGRRW